MKVSEIMTKNPATCIDTASLHDVAQMMAGKFDIFKGPLNDNKGKAVIAAGKSYPQTDLELEKMNYLVEGVIGSIG